MTGSSNLPVTGEGGFHVPPQIGISDALWGPSVAQNNHFGAFFARAIGIMGSVAGVQEVVLSTPGILFGVGLGLGHLGSGDYI